MARLLYMALWVVCVALLPLRVAHAHPLLSEAHARVDAADFEGALEVLEQAERTEGLSRESVVELLEVRALAHYALSSRKSMRRELERLCALSPSHALGRTFPPQLRSAWRRACRGRKSALGLRASALPVSEGLRLAARAVHSAPGLVHDVLVWARVAPSSTYRVLSPVPALVHAGPGTTVEYFAQALGPGGSVIAQLGTPDQPRAFTMPGEPEPELTPSPQPAVSPVIAPPEAPRSVPSVPPPADSRVARRWWLGGSVAALAAAGGAVAALLLLPSNSPSTRLSAPTLAEETP